MCSLRALAVRTLRGCAVVALTLVVVGAAGPARAQSAGTKVVKAAPADAGPGTPGAAQTPSAPPAPLEAIVRGFFIGARFVGGTMVKSDKIPATSALVPGQPEKFGTGTMLQLEMGYDITSALAIELVGGSSFVQGTRGDWVRDLNVVFGGAAVRVAPAITDRLRVVVAAGAGYASADNTVEKPQQGAAAFGSLGLEYYVHVRHFSLGLDVSALAPLKPMRVFVGLGPQVKYTF